MKKIGFIGAGNMAGALIRGLLASQRYKPADIDAYLAANTVSHRN